MRPRGSLKVATHARSAFNLSVPKIFMHCDKANPFISDHVILSAKIANGSLSYILGHQDLREVPKATKIARCVVHMIVRILLLLGIANSALIVVCYSREQKMLFHSSKNQYHCFERDQHMQKQGLLTFLTYHLCKQVVFCSLRHVQVPFAIFVAVFPFRCHAKSAHG
jgi:hypothetical protein